MPVDNPAFDLDQVRRHCARCDLRDLCLPAGLDAADVERVDDIVADRTSLATGSTLYHAGSPFRALYVIKTGSLKTQAVSEGGELQILGFHLPGEIMGFDALAGERHQCSAEALEASSVCRLPYAELERICAAVPGLQRQFMRLVSREMGDDHDHMAMMGRNQAIARLALFLHSMSKRQTRLGRSADQLTLTMSRADLANYLGLVLETVSRLFGRLQEMGLIEVRRREIKILDREGLKSVGEC
ncbi:MAG: helix-turn-helix domain-containing protein [Gammaproteobacteria bacterium]|jgi:CRP/FNR family transcriptional regulator|nr:helix-turn-helix domain-containing protein [Gammaproteobacteria bacterium]